MVTAVAMSGGVDSSAAAWLLKNDSAYLEKYPDNRIIGVTHWWDELNLSSPGLKARAEAVCKRLGIPYRVIALGGSFKKSVIDDFAGCYINGETPNPCVRCNERLRFSEFYNKCMRELSESSDGDEFRFCTGHYVRTEVRDGRSFLKKAVDKTKDQSYMLYRIPSEVLNHCIFPLGEFTKEKIKAIANEHGFFGSAIKESQDICFIDDDYVSFLKRYLSTDALNKHDNPGAIYNIEGRRLGPSRGFLHYTIGQRKGLGLGDGPWYVAAVDPRRNRVIVGRKNQLGVKKFRVKELNWFIEPPASIECRVQLRYNSTEYACRAEVSVDQPGSYDVELEAPAVSSPGQSAVFYDGDIVIGGGIISRPAEGLADE